MDRRRLPADARRAQLVGIALRQIARDGATRVTAAGIGAEAGITDAAVFRHFPTLSALIEAAIDHFIALLAGSLDRPEASPLAQLEGFFLHRLALVQAHPEVLQLAFNERLADAAQVEGAQRVRAMVERSQSFVREALRAAQQVGEVRGDVPVRALAWTLTGHLRGAARAALSQPVAPPEVFADLMKLLAPAGPEAGHTPRGDLP